MFVNLNHWNANLLSIKLPIQQGQQRYQVNGLIGVGSMCNFIVIAWLESY